MEAVTNQEYTLADALYEAKIKGAEKFQHIRLFKIPRPHQIEGLRDTLRNKQWGLWDDPGTGKSLIAYMYATIAASRGSKTIALTKPGLVDQFAEEIYNEMDVQMSVHALNQPPAERNKLYAKYKKQGWPDLLIISYPMFLREFPKIDTRQYPNVIADEAHKLKNPSSQTYKAVKQYIDDKRFVPMTGSPQPTTPEDAYGLISLLTPDAYRSKRAFDRKHLMKQNTGRFWVTVGYKNLDDLSDNLYAKARRVCITDVLPLDKPNVVEVPVTLSTQHMNLYRKLVSERMLELGSETITAIEAAALRKHCFSLAAFPSLYSNNKVSSNVLQTLDDQLDTINLKETKALIFASYVNNVEGLGEYLEEYNPAMIYGKTNNNAGKKKFIEDDSCRVAIINPTSGAEGLDGMQKVCHNVLFFEPVGSPGLFNQAAARLWRSGQENVVNVYVFKVHGTAYVKAIATMLGRTEAMKQSVLKVGSLLDEFMGKM